MWNLETCTYPQHNCTERRLKHQTSRGQSSQGRESRAYSSVRKFQCPAKWTQGHWILNWTEISVVKWIQFSLSSVQVKKICTCQGSALSSVQFRSKKRGRIFWTRINAQTRSKNAPKRPKTPQNAPKRPKNVPKRPKNARFLDLKTPVFFSSVQFTSVFSGQEFRWISPGAPLPFLRDDEERPESTGSKKE